MGIATYAVVDLETTGNQLEYDDIIQIGITFVRNNKISGTYHSMVRTDLEIPPFIQALTSIEEDMLAQAPYFYEIAQEVYSQLKDCIFVAHNVDFDLNFIKKAFSDCNLQFRPKKVIDTLEIFKIAFPTDKSYQLSELATAHQIPLANAHRADEDAKTTALLMIKAFNKFEQLPLDTLKQLYYLSKHLKYDLFDILFEMVRTHDAQPLGDEYDKFEQLIYRKQQDLKGAVTDYDGSLKDLYQSVTEQLNLTYRPQQLYLAETILEQLMHSQKAMIEASVGSGKSLAYLLAALIYNIDTGKHVMISTNTKLLQSQLLEKDIPALNQALNFKINALLIKSKSDYISLGLISQIVKDETSNYEVSVLKMQLLIWITETTTGDIQELNLKGGQKMYFDQKIETYVPVRHDIHYYNFIKRNAPNIQIGITNHAHLIHSDAENSIYQLFDDCIIDEAHRLPDYALNQVTNELSYADVKYQLGLIGRNENEKLLKAIDELEQRRILEKLDIAPIDVFSLKTSMNEIHDLNERLFTSIFEIVKASEVYDDEIHRFHNVFNFDKSQILKDLHQIIDKLNKTIELFNGMSHKTIKTLRKQLLYLKDKFKDIEQSLKADHTSFISIKNLAQKSTIRLYVKDYEVKDILTEQVLEKFQSLILISGTLKFNQSFDTFKRLFNKDTHFNTFEVMSPVQHSKNTNVFIPSDVASYQYQNIDDYVASIVNYIIEYTSVTESKCLVLFTSYKMMHMVQEMLNELPEFEDYIVLTQQQNQNYKIVQQFNSFNKAILLGTSTFFEGFDFQAEGIKCVMIAKLPFMNKHNAKYWLMDSEFDSTFKEYVLPDAVTRFRQGLGRLIRNEHDKGIIVSFDDRLVNSNYKNFFAQTLEHYRQKKGDIHQFSKLLHQIQRQNKKKK